MAQTCKHGTRPDGMGCLECASEAGVLLAEQIRTFPEREADLKARIQAWAASPDGQKKLAEALDAAATEAARLGRVQRMKPEDWNIRITI